MNQKIREKLNEMIENPVGELNYEDDFTLLIAIMLSAQTLDKKVNLVTPLLFDKFKKPGDIKEKHFDEIEEIIRPLGLSKVKAKNIINISKKIIEKFNSKVPSNFDELITLDGIGNKTAKVMLVEYYKQNYFPVDTHVSRVAKRLLLVDENDSVEKVEEKLTIFFENKELGKLHQQFVLHGRYRCTAKNPKCDECKLKPCCNFYKNFN